MILPQRLKPVLIAGLIGCAGLAHAQPPGPPAPAPPIAAPQDPDDPEERDIPVDPTAPPPVPGAPIDAEAWWKAETRAPVRVDPLGDRRAKKGDPKVRLTNDTPALLYRLWGLPPLQTMVLRPGEVVLEVWVRPSGKREEAIVRVSVRRDGNVFVQARAGIGCCQPEIARRVDIDEKAELDGAAFKALAKSPVWRQPREVTIERPGEARALCVKGAAYDVTLLDYAHSVHLRRICDQEAVGSVAPVLQAVLGAAFGKDPRFDAVIRRADFSYEAQAYAGLLADGGRLSARSPSILKP
ncbi:hypothetical protein BH11PSE2_BH11PSE2_09850 [soil metagenome]